MTWGHPCLCDGRDDITCIEKECSIAGPGEEFNPNQCRICWLRTNTFTPYIKPNYVATTGPGTELTSLLQSLGIDKLPGCQCEQRRIDMDNWGVEGCRANRYIIIEWLQEGYAQTGWAIRLRVGANAVIQGIAISTDPLGSIVDEAIRRAEAKLIATSNSVQLVVSADGIGDHLLGLAAANRWKLDNPTKSLTFIAKSWQAQWVYLFEGYDSLFTNLVPNVQQICDISNRGGLHYVEAIQDYTFCIPKLKPLPQEATKWAEEYKDYIVLCPGAGYRRPGSPDWAVSNRVWLPSHWLVLEKLLLDNGKRVVTIDSDSKRIRHHKEQLINLPASKVTSLIKIADCIVSNESGMAHLAGILQTPCIVLCGPLEGNKIYKPWTKTKVMQGPLSCSGCRWIGPNFREHCDTLCASLQSIQPEEVATTLNKIVESKVKLSKIVSQVDSAKWHDRNRIFGITIDLLEGKPNLCMVETGCQRQEYDIGAGMSTLILGLYAYLNNGTLLSIDNDPKHVSLAIRVIAGLPVKVSLSCSVTFLKDYNGPKIDLLYLDSLDTYVDGYAEHSKLEVETALPNLSSNALILIDDTWLEDNNKWSGKGKLAVPYLLSQGWKVVCTNYQTLLSRQRS